MRFSKMLLFGPMLALGLAAMPVQSASTTTAFHEGVQFETPWLEGEFASVELFAANRADLKLAVETWVKGKHPVSAVTPVVSGFAPPQYVIMEIPRLPLDYNWPEVHVAANQ